MPLAYEIREPLEIPADAFNADGVAILLVQGARYGGCWLLAALPMNDGNVGEPAGSIFTERDERPSMAVDTALIWLNDACVQAGLNLAHFESKNGEIPADQAPYFAGALAVIDRRDCGKEI